MEQKRFQMKWIVLILAITMVVSLLISSAIFFTGGRSSQLYQLQSPFSFFNWSWNQSGTGRYNSGSNNGDGSPQQGSYELDEEKIVDLTNQSAVSITGISAPLTVYYTEDSTELRVHLYGNSTDQTRMPWLEVKTSGGKVTISEKRPGGIFTGFYSEQVNLDVYLPASYQNSLSLYSVSGRISADRLEQEAVKLETVSGAIRVDRLVAEETQVNTVSGSISLEQVAGNLSADSVSGSVKAFYVSLDQNISIETISGSVQLYLPEDAAFRISAKSTSGQIHCEFPVTLQGSISRNQLNGTVKSDQNKINLSTVSGGISIDYSRN